MNIVSLEQSIYDVITQCEGRVSIAIDLHPHTISINSQEIYPAASLIKIPILLAGVRQAQQEVIDLEQLVTIPPKEKVGGAGVLSALSDTITLTVKDLLTLMIIVSDNTATNLLIDRLGRKSIDELCNVLSLEHTSIKRKLMDFEGMERGFDNQTSASDMIRCLKAIDKSTLFESTSRDMMLHILGQQQFYDKLPAMMNRQIVSVANKTGELPGVEHDCAIIRYKGKTAYIAVLIDQLENNHIGRQTITQIGHLLYTYLVSR
ncbi:serine hydrolase [Metabacillus iocasae]|uniref:Beta-lactamase class A n=1 Tax=Priestia iocasae TaxID=2291674 RepID=A0ABS2QUQ8_9BACI|nr:serine hydrolase [Metabacillus iocasae]MBM7703230.1 beta-lactamase class A [Metabacillus iocasae]